MESDFTLDLANEAETLYFAAHLAQVLPAYFVVYLHGNLGAGKTTLVRGVLHALGFVGKVKSPTYTLVESYAITRNGMMSLDIHHFDLYRFNDDEEWDAAGFRDYFNANSLCLIEWPEKAHHVLPSPDMDITLTMQEGVGNGRHLHIVVHSLEGKKCLDALKQCKK